MNPLQLNIFDAILDHVNASCKGLTANFDLSKTAALIIACLDLREFGRDYARMGIANAQALAQALASGDCPVYHVPGQGYTASHHIAIPAADFGGGNFDIARFAQE